MPDFQYEAYLQDGKIERSHLAAIDRNAAYQLLKSAGKSPIQIEALTGSKLTRRKSDRSAKRADKAGLDRVISDLSILLRSGFTIDQSLGVLAADGIHNKEKQLPAVLLDQMRSGKSLSIALAEIGAPSTTVALTSAGEVSGKLADILSDLARASRERDKRSSELQEALLYPIFLIIVMLVALGVLAFYLVPAITPIFEASGAEPPALFQVLDSVRQFVTGDGLILITGISILALAIVSSRAGRGAFRAVSFRLPLIGRFRLEAIASRYLHTLALLVGSGVDIRQAMSLATLTGSTSGQKSRFEAAEKDIRSGSRIHQALDKSGVFSAAVIAHVQLGESSNNLSLMLERCATAIDVKQRRQLDRLMTFLTPSTTIIMGAIVGSLVISVMTALLSINDIAVR